MTETSDSALREDSPSQSGDNSLDDSMEQDEKSSRRSQAESSVTITGEGSPLFRSYRTLGRVSNHVPCVLYRSEARKETYVVTCVGRSWHIYSLRTMGVTRVSDPHPDSITALAADEYYVVAAAGCHVYVRAHRTNRLAAHFTGHSHPVRLLLSFGHHVVSVDTGGLLAVWEKVGGKEHARVTFNPAAFEPTAMCHPAAYRDKVLVGSLQGALQLWNVKAAQLVYEFVGWESEVTALRAAPALDTVAVGLADGRVVLHNIRMDESVFTLRQDWGAVAAVAFRLDGPPVMLSSSGTGGHVAVWDLVERRLVGVMETAHTGGAFAAGLECPDGEPLVVTSGADNCLNVWVFEGADSVGGARLLKRRSGHSAPPVCLHFVSATDVLSAAQDASLCSFSTDHARHDRSFGFATLARGSGGGTGPKRARKERKESRRLPAVTQLSAESRRASDWPGVLTCHASSRWVSQWDACKGSLAHLLRFEASYGHVTCVTTTGCGNYGVVGFSSGALEAVNMQSRLPLGKRGPGGGGVGGHVGAVRGVAVGEVNQWVVSGGADGLLIWWKFKGSRLGELKLDAPVSLMEVHRPNAMLAVALDDFSVVIVDGDSRRVTRRLGHHTSSVTSLAFSAHGRWLLTGTMDCRVTTFDLPTGQPVDVLSLETPPTALAFSPAGDLLAVTTVDELGVTLLSNRAMYTHVSLTAIDIKKDYGVTSHAACPPVVVELDESDNDDDNGDDSARAVPTGRHGDDSTLVMLARLPTSRWAHLSQLDVIRRRNKPKAPPTKPKAAPFFLPTVAGLTPRFAIEEGAGGTQDGEGGPPVPVPTDQELLHLLKLARTDEGAAAVITFLKGLGPSAIDTAVRSLSAHFGERVGAEEEEVEGAAGSRLGLFLCALARSLRSGQNYDVTQGYLSLTLKVHGQEITSHPELLNLLGDITSAQGESWARLEGPVRESMAVLQYMKRAAL